MKKFETLTSVCCPLPIRDVDTDMIIPAQFMTSTSREGYGQNLFRRLRDESPNFPLNQTRYKDAKIIIASENFGCGSSREHAVWALMSWGIRVILAPSFADIFASNGAKSGLLLVPMEQQRIEDFQRRAQSESGLILTVDLQNQQITESDGSAHKFKYNSFRKHCILNGLDDLDYILSKSSEINSFRTNQPSFN